MTFDEFQQHLASTGHSTESAHVGADTYLVIKDMPISAGPHAGRRCDVGILSSAANPWVPQAAVHVRPHLVEMGQAASQASALGAEWQYLSRRFDRAPSPKSFLAHILTVLGQV